MRVAVKERNLDMVKFLVSQGANIHANNDEALYYASGNGDLEILKYLLASKVNPSACKEALLYAEENGQMEAFHYIKVITFLS